MFRLGQIGGYFPVTIGPSLNGPPMIDDGDIEYDETGYDNDGLFANRVNDRVPIVTVATAVTTN
jgi:hypothetical protein